MYLIFCRLRRGGSHKLGELAWRKHRGLRPFRIVHLNRRNGLPTGDSECSVPLSMFFINLQVLPKYFTTMYSSLFEVNTLLVSLGLTAVLAGVLCLKATPAYVMALSSNIPKPDSEKCLRDIPTHVLKRLTPKSKACVERLRTSQLDRPDL